jgi:DNA-nicking Smr family endonuclease
MAAKRFTQWADLATVQQTLKQKRELAQAREDTERALAAKQLRERNLFAEAVGAVTPVLHAPTAPIKKPKPDAIPRQRILDEAAALAESMSDGFDVENLLDTDDGLSYRRSGVGPDVLRKLRRGEWAIQAELDLHGLRRDEARNRVGDFLREAEKLGLRCVRIIHGKGLGSPGREPVLKAKVRSWLVQRNQVMGFVQAGPTDGGHGAVLVLLRSVVP